MSIVKTDIPMTAGLCEQTIYQLAKGFPIFQTRTLTTTAGGRPVLHLRMGTGSRKVIFSAAHHANEWITAPVLLKFAEDTARAAEEDSRIGGVSARALLETATIHMVPMVNPDGVDLVTGEATARETETARDLAEFYPDIPFPSGWKANLAGVDLNLQYPAGWLQAREIKFSQGYTRPGPRDYVGRSPLDQPEARAMAELTEQENPALVLALHSQGQVIFWQFDDIPVPGARELGEEFARLSGYTLADTPYASSFAGYKDWFIRMFRRPGYTIEVGSGTNPLPLSQFGEIYRDCLGILVTAAMGLSE